MKIAILGASHWHVPLMYLDALNALGEEIVAVADRSEDLVDIVKDKVDCPRYTDYERCLAETKPDFVFAHAPHRDMTDLAAWLAWSTLATSTSASCRVSACRRDKPSRAVAMHSSNSQIGRAHV